TRNIEFVARKGGQKPTKKGLFSIHLSSYFDAVRGLPSKSSFPHAYPFLVDRCIELREVSKLTTFASGAVTLTQALFQFDATVASYALAGSIGAFFLFKQVVEKMEPQAKVYINNKRKIDYKNSQELDAMMQKIKNIQSNEKVQMLLHPPSQEELKKIVQDLGIHLDKNEKIRLVPL
ncbi:MAG: hypothetical protein K1000chlam3_01449, partial [Chlamydiae bacterium]|nr:hypothetical protein [Chlamydiota bacterium]